MRGWGNEMKRLLGMALCGGLVLNLSFGVSASEDISEQSAAGNLPSVPVSMAMADEGDNQVAPTASASPQKEVSVTEDETGLSEDELSKFDANLRKLLLNPPQDLDTVVTVIVKSSDRGKEFKEYVGQHSGSIGSSHGPIITGRLPFRAVAGVGRLASVSRIEGDTALYPMNNK